MNYLSTSIADDKKLSNKKENILWNNKENMSWHKSQKVNEPSEL